MDCLRGTVAVKVDNPESVSRISTKIKQECQHQYNTTTIRHPKLDPPTSLALEGVSTNTFPRKLPQLLLHVI